MDDVRDNYNLINRYVASEKPRKELTDQFVRILNKVGDRNTSQAQEMFRNIN